MKYLQFSYNKLAYSQLIWELCPPNDLGRDQSRVVKFQVVGHVWDNHAVVVTPNSEHCIAGVGNFSNHVQVFVVFL
jgi:hypothetical protein